MSDPVRANWASSGRGVLVSAGNNQANSKRPLSDPRQAPKRFQLTPNGPGDVQLVPECFPKSIPTSINPTKNMFWDKKSLFLDKRSRNINPNINKSNKKLMYLDKKHCFGTKCIWAHAAPKSCKTLMFGKCLFHPLMQQVGVGSQSVHRLMLQAAACQDCCKCGAPRHSMPPCIIVRPYC